MKQQTQYFKTAQTLAQCINDYFLYIEGEFHTEQKPIKSSKESPEAIAEQKVWDREPEPATIAGMALFLGFSSKEEFENYETHGKHAGTLKRGSLRIEAAYEARLHQTPTGVIFALKTMGWNDKPQPHKPPGTETNTLEVKIINSGPLPAGSEKEISL